MRDGTVGMGSIVPFFCLLVLEVVPPLQGSAISKHFWLPIPRARPVLLLRSWHNRNRMQSLTRLVGCRGRSPLLRWGLGRGFLLFMRVFALTLLPSTVPAQVLSSVLSWSRTGEYCIQRGNSQHLQPMMTQGWPGGLSNPAGIFRAGTLKIARFRGERNAKYCNLEGTLISPGNRNKCHGSH